MALQTIHVGGGKITATTSDIVEGRGKEREGVSESDTFHRDDNNLSNLDTLIQNYFTTFSERYILVPCLIYLNFTH